jgi:hypothetical protein
MPEYIKCDACIARAVNSILLSNGGSIHLCQHHTNEHSEKLSEANAIISNLESVE